jgi:hypothetical protein
MKKTLRQVTKIVVDADKLKALCVTMKGITLAFDVSLVENQELKTLADEFAMKVLDSLEKEIG